MNSPYLDFLSDSSLGSSFGNFLGSFLFFSTFFYLDASALLLPSVIAYLCYSNFIFFDLGNSFFLYYDLSPPFLSGLSSSLFLSYSIFLSYIFHSSLSSYVNILVASSNTFHVYFNIHHILIFLFLAGQTSISLSLIGVFFSKRSITLLLEDEYLIEYLSAL